MQQEDLNSRPQSSLLLKSWQREHLRRKLVVGKSRLTMLRQKNLPREPIRGSAMLGGDRAAIPHCSLRI